MILETELLRYAGAPRDAPGREEEWAGGLTLSEAVERFKEDGYMVLEGLLPPELMEELRAEYTLALDAKVKRFGLKAVTCRDERGRLNDGVLNEFKPEGGNHDLNRWNMHLPSRPPFFDGRVVANPAVLALMDRLFKTDYACYLVASDTPYPGAGYQNMHQDFSRFSVAVNIPLVDFDEENAPIEVWPRTHRPDAGGPAEGFTTDYYYIGPERMREIKAGVPSRRLLLKAGSLLVRDHRLVHRGTANVSARPRPMLSVYYCNPRPVPYRWLSGLGVRAALALRRFGRGRGEQVQFPALFNMGNVLGRVAEEYSLTDRDYRREIPRAVWDALSPAARHTLRYARRKGAGPEPGAGSLAGCGQFARAFIRNAGTALASALLSRPRKPDEDARSSGRKTSTD